MAQQWLDRGDDQAQADSLIRVSIRKAIRDDRSFLHLTGNPFEPNLWVHEILLSGEATTNGQIGLVKFWPEPGPDMGLDWFLGTAFNFTAGCVVEVMEWSEAEMALRRTLDMLDLYGE